jgi:hypothetical protein
MRRTLVHLKLLHFVFRVANMHGGAITRRVDLLPRIASSTHEHDKALEFRLKKVGAQLTVADYGCPHIADATLFTLFGINTANHHPR